MKNIVHLPSRKSTANRFEKLMRPHFAAIYAAARRIAASDADAEDLVQEVSMKAFLKLDDLEQIEYQRAWLLRVLYNVFIDAQRAHQRSPVSLAESPTDFDEAALPAGKHTQPDEQADRMMRLDLILRAMKLLNKDRCAMLALHDIDGFSLAELHSITGIPLGTIKSQLHRTRIKLGRLLRHELGDKPCLKLVGEG